MDTPQAPSGASPGLNQRADQLSRLIDVIKSMAAQLDLEPLLQQIVNSAGLLLKADMGGLLVLNEGSNTFQYF